MSIEYRMAAVAQAKRLLELRRERDEAMTIAVELRAENARLTAELALAAGWDIVRAYSREYGHATVTVAP